MNNSTIIRLKEKNFTKNLITQIKKLKYKYILVEGGSKTISELINNKYIDIIEIKTNDYIEKYRNFTRFYKKF